MPTTLDRPVRTSLRSLYRVLGLLLFAGVALMRVEKTAGADKAAAQDAKSPPAVYALLHFTKHARENDPITRREPMIAMFKSGTVLNATLSKLHVAALPAIKERKDPRTWLQQNLKTEFLDNTNILRISLGGGSPEEQAILINAVTEAWLRGVIEDELKLRSERLDNLERFYRGYEERLRIMRRNPERLREDEEEAVKIMTRLACELSGLRAQLDAPPLARLLEAAEVPKSK